MIGLTMAFQDFRASLGFFKSDFVGMKHFARFFNAPSFIVILRNTFLLSVYSLIIGFPFPIILAVCLNELRKGLYKRFVQLVTYAPYFISTTVMVSLIILWTDMRIGIINNIINIFGFARQDFMGQARAFRTIYISSGIWQYAGFNSIIYLAALSSVDPQLHEAAIMDGATKFKRIWHIDIPGILPTVIILMILNCGQLLNVGFEKTYLMQTPLNTPVSEIISTYVYKIGIQQTNFSFATAIGFFNSVVNLILIASVNAIAKRTGETSLW
jgi:putative aldouronate transport system permease protein